MTVKQKQKLMRKLRRGTMTRKQIEAFCSGETDFELFGEIEALASEGIIRMASEPTFISGCFAAKPDDTFELADTGKDLIASIQKERFRFYLPICISILALLIALASFIVSILSFNRPPL